MNKLHVTQLNDHIFGIYKPAGYTPLQALKLLQEARPELADTPLTYAGRLDPMAEGLLLVLAGDAVHEKETYLGLDKTYIVTALLAVETDSWDLLGIPVTPERSALIEPVEQLKHEHDIIQDILGEYVGKVTLPLPLYSSPPHNGKPLHWWGQQGLLEASNTPHRESMIYSISNVSQGMVLSTALLSYIEKTIPTVHGSFRQDEIRNAWKKVLSAPHSFSTLTFTVHCSSGTYIRSLVHDIGKKLGTGACIYTLTRSQIGSYSLDSTL